MELYFVFRERRAKREASKIPQNWTPCYRDINWFLESDEKSPSKEVDISDHPDKYVQAEIFYESDRRALQFKDWILTFPVKFGFEARFRIPFKVKWRFLFSLTEKLFKSSRMLHVSSAVGFGE